MQVILSPNCTSFTGSIGRGFGYYIQARRNKRGRVTFHAARQARGYVPPDGHLRFILTCAEIVCAQLYFTNIVVKKSELYNALIEAQRFIPAQNLRLDTYRARDIINLKTTFGI